MLGNIEIKFNDVWSFLNFFYEIDIEKLKIMGFLLKRGWDCIFIVSVI